MFRLNSTNSQIIWLSCGMVIFVLLSLNFFALPTWWNAICRWYAKRFLHPDIVSAYEYIFIWDEDLGVEHFNGDKYEYMFACYFFFSNLLFVCNFWLINCVFIIRFVELIKRHDLEISQPALENSDSTWEMTKRRGDRSVHK